ncbi:hypothetical protein C8R44DRAFT_880776 [Mycena epipterygia]|nr:hypothetical protein C8R44DRAFT_880776 [Mycena epipterygia]
MSPCGHPQTAAPSFLPPSCFSPSLRTTATPAPRLPLAFDTHIPPPLAPGSRAPFVVPPPPLPLFPLPLRIHSRSATRGNHRRPPTSPLVPRSSLCATWFAHTAPFSTPAAPGVPAALPQLAAPKPPPGIIGDEGSRRLVLPFSAHTLSSPRASHFTAPAARGVRAALPHPPASEPPRVIIGDVHTPPWCQPRPPTLPGSRAPFAVPPPPPPSFPPPFRTPAQAPPRGIIGDNHPRCLVPTFPTHGPSSPCASHFTAPAAPGVPAALPQPTAPEPPRGIIVDDGPRRLVPPFPAHGPSSPHAIHFTAPAAPGVRAALPHSPAPESPRVIIGDVHTPPLVPTSPAHVAWFPRAIRCPASTLRPSAPQLQRRPGASSSTPPPVVWYRPRLSWRAESRARPAPPAAPARSAAPALARGSIGAYPALFRGPREFFSFPHFPIPFIFSLS